MSRRKKREEPAVLRVCEVWTRWCLNCGKGEARCHCRRPLLAHDRARVDVIMDEPHRMITPRAERFG